MQFSSKDTGTGTMYWYYVLRSGIPKGNWYYVLVHLRTSKKTNDIIDLIIDLHLFCPMIEFAASCFGLDTLFSHSGFDICPLR